MNELTLDQNSRTALVVLFAFLIIIVALLILEDYTQKAFGQSTETEGCHILEFREYAYTPFRIYMVHDPAVKQVITDDHNDPLSRLVMDQISPREQRSSLGFFTNSTDNWRIRVDLEYQVESIEPRETTVTFYSNSQEYFKSTFFDVGFTSCFLFNVNARPPIIPLTEAQILEVADKIAEENIELLAQKNQLLVDRVEESAENNTFLSIIYSALFVAVLVSGLFSRRGGRNLKKDMLAERENLATERGLIVLDRKNAGIFYKALDDGLKKNFAGIQDQIMVIAKSLKIDLARKDWRSAIAIKHDLVQETTPIEKPKPVEIDEKQEKSAEEIYEKQQLGDTAENIKKKTTLADVGKKITDIPKAIKDIRKSEEPIVTTKEQWKIYYRESLKDDTALDKYTKKFQDVHAEWEAKPTDKKLLELYALTELANEANK